MDRFPILHFPIYATWIAAFKVVARSGTSEFRAGWTGAQLLCHSLATVMLGLAAQQKLICRPNEETFNLTNHFNPDPSTLGPQHPLCKVRLHWRRRARRDHACDPTRGQADVLIYTENTLD